MKKLILSILLSLTLASGAHAWMSPVVAGGGVEAAGCSASYGAEENTSTNATEADASDADATTDWSNSGCSTFETITTAPHTGTYHLTCVADSNNDRCYTSMNNWSLSDGSIYKLSIYVRHNGTGGDWATSLNATSSTVDTEPVVFTIGDTSYEEIVRYFIKGTGSDYLVFKENSGTNDGGVYIDTLSCKEATLCYGSELHTDANAASPSNETNATTGWTNNSVDTFESTSSDSPDTGSYHLHISEAATGDSDCSIYKDIGTDFSLNNGTKYFISFAYKHSGNGNNWIGGFSDSTSSPVGNMYVGSSTTTYTDYGFSFVYDSDHRYWIFKEYSADNDGEFWIDNFSIKEITNE